MAGWVRLALRAAAVTALAAIVAFTISTIEMRPRTSASADLERFAAYAVLGLVWALAFPRRLALVAVFLGVVAVGLEAAQELSPSRHGRVSDAAVKIAGALAGIGGALLPRLLRR